MKSLWNNFKVAFAMFSKIPMPRADWTKENMKYMFCFFPFIGTVIGVLTVAVAYAGRRFGYQPGFVTALLVLCDRRDPCGRAVGYLGCPQFLAGEVEKTRDSERFPCRSICSDHCSRVFCNMVRGI